MRRGFLVSFVAALTLLAIHVQETSAWRDAETPGTVDLTQVQIYPTQLLGLGEVLAEFAPDDPALAGIAEQAVGIDAAPLEPTTADPPGTLVVDDDLQQCPSATFMSINAAVTAAMPGDTIRVCPGIYNETVTVNKTLTLRGASHGSGSGQCKDAAPPDPTRDSIVHGFAFYGFNLIADGIVLDGFVVENQSDGPGIYTSPLSSGYLIRDNIVQNNVFGIYFNSSGATESVVRKNCIRTNNRAGAASGNGIYSDQGLRNGVIEHNFLTGNVNSAITLTGAVAPLADVLVQHNKSLADDSAVALFYSTRVEVSYNKADNSTGSAIFLGPDNHDLLITKNHLSNGDFNGIRFNAAVPPPGGPPSTNVEVSNNQIQDMNRSGISVAPNSLANSLLSKNHSHDNAEDGIRIEVAGNAGNHIVANKLKHNTEHDCHDDTLGPGTGGTANIWEKNEGDTENRPGLCKKKP